ncbi:MAG: Gar1/Naf1 family protein [Candidatus Methanoplasma sp.]|jgi:RNA-binding protein|nr:Gar1/Naf1 family protein [Candidatus Methanoplasma sp.]
MEFLGIVDSMTDTDGFVVIGTSNVPEIGSPVFDSDRNKIGSIKRIFGPVEEPFISVAAFNSANVRMLKGKEVYTTRRTQNGKDKRRNRRD